MTFISTMPFASATRTAALLSALFCGAGTAWAQTTPTGSGSSAAAPVSSSAPRSAATNDSVNMVPAQSAYCQAVGDAATDARFAWQVSTLEAMKAEVEEKTRQLEEKRAETEKWLTRRDAFLDKVEDRVVLIYSRMRADAAAAQIAAMQDETAAALLTKLEPRSASAIFNEMEAARAAYLAAIITGAARRTGIASRGEGG